MKMCCSAKKNNIFLELTSRKGHSNANNHVAKKALEHGAKLILDNDSHEPEDIITPEELAGVGINAGLNKENIDTIYKNVELFLKNGRLK